jgi:hypothetical protein
VSFLDRKPNATETAILANEKTILKNQGVIMADLTALTAQVATNTTVEGSALLLIQGLASQLQAAGTDPVALANLQQQLATSDTALAAAVLANTAATPQPPPPQPTS